MKHKYDVVNAKVGYNCFTEALYLFPLHALLIIDPAISATLKDWKLKQRKNP